MTFSNHTDPETFLYSHLVHTLALNGFLVALSWSLLFIMMVVGHSVEVTRWATIFTRFLTLFSISELMNQQRTQNIRGLGRHTETPGREPRFIYRPSSRTGYLHFS